MVAEWRVVDMPQGMSYSDFVISLCSMGGGCVNGNLALFL